MSDSFLNHEYSHAGNKSSATERAITIASGALMLAPVLRKRSIINWATAAAGGALIFDGISGSCAVSRGLGLSSRSRRTERLRESIRIARSADELYALWRRPSTYAELMRPFADVQPLGAHRLRWSIPLPIGKALEGEAVLTGEEPGRMIHWRTLPDAQLQIDEWFRLKEISRREGTEVSLEYLVNSARVPGGGMLTAVSAFFEKAASMMIRRLLYDFKTLAETGRVSVTEHDHAVHA